MTSIRLRLALVLAMLLVGAVPALSQAQAPAETAVLQANPAAEALARHLSLGTGTTSERDAQLLVVLAAFYQERQMAPLWLDAGGPSGRAEVLAGVLRTADQRGLDPADYHASTIDELLSAGAPDQRAELELRLSLGLLEITSDLASGRLEPQQVNPELFVYPQEVDPAAVIRAAAGAQDIAAFVAGYEPSQPEYQRLKAALADYRALAAAGGWPTIDDGPTLKPDMTGPRVAQLRARLGVPPAPGADPARFDPALAAAVKEFQLLQGLEQDGLIGQNTLAELNVPAGERVRQILLNLERRRWMADNPGERYVFVNLADFELKVVDGPRTVFDTRVVVGAPYHRTPVFSGDMTYIEINPYWNVPPSIARNELLPKIKADPGYLAANNFELLERLERQRQGARPAQHRLERRDARALHLQAAPGARRRQRARPHQVHVPQPVQHLSARHAGARPVRPGRARLQPRLHPGAGSRGLRQLRARPPAGLVAGRDQCRDRDRETADRDPRCAAAGAHRLSDGMGEQRRHGTLPTRRLRPRCDPRRRPARPAGLSFVGACS